MGQRGCHPLYRTWKLQSEQFSARPGLPSKTFGEVAGCRFSLRLDGGKGG